MTITLNIGLLLLIFYNSPFFPQLLYSRKYPSCHPNNSVNWRKQRQRRRRR